MTRTIPTGIIVLVILTLLFSIVLFWTRRGEYGERGLSGWWRLAEDFALTNLLIMMVAAAVIQVVTRFLLSDFIAIGWTEEFALFCLIWMSFAAGAFIIREGGHIAFEVIFLALPPGFQRAILIVGDLILITVLTPIAWYGYQDARWLDLMMTVSLGISLDKFAYVVPVTLSLMVILTLVQFVGHIRMPSGRLLETEPGS